MKIQDSNTYKGIRWQVIFSFLFSWLCHSVSAQLHYSIPEEMRKDSVIANIAADLGLEIEKFHIVLEKYAYVNLQNGNLYIKDRIDRETLCGRKSTCYLSFDAVADDPLTVFAVSIEIQDINDNSPFYFIDTINLAIVEITPQGTQFILQTAEDPDIGINSVQTYKLSDNQHFTLSEKTSTDGSTLPVLVLEKPLDRETQNIHELILTAMDGGNPIRTGTAVISITVTDVNDNFPIFTQDIYKVSVSENTPINTTILHVTATDQDEGSNAQTTYSFAKTSGNAVSFEMFRINATGGEININKILDFETTKNYEISVQAMDGGGLVTHSKVLVEVIDENDNAPEISIASITFPIREDVMPGTRIVLIKVSDQDSEENGNVDCQIIGNVPFQLIMSSSKYYKIVTTNTMDREKESSYNITVLATDKGSFPLSTTKTISINISDVNDNPPVFSKGTYAAYVPENNLPGSSIYRMQALDYDAGDNAKIFYFISSINTEDTPVSSYLSINVETGVLYAQRSFDYEQHKEFQIQVTATDNGSPSLSSNATLMVHIMDQNDNAPRILYPSTEGADSTYFEMVSLASEDNALITKVVAVDADSGHNSWLSYHFIQASEPSPFSINQHTGEIRTTRAFDQKDVLKYKVMVLVKDNGIPSMSATVTISLIVADTFQQVVPKFINHINDDDSPSSLQFYLVIALVLISFLFILSVMLVIVSKCRESKSLSSFGSLSTNLYAPVHPQMLSQHNNGTLPLPYSYNVCVALDSTESDFTFINPKQDVAIENLIDADDSGLENEDLKDTLSPNSLLKVSNKINVTKCCYFKTIEFVCKDGHGQQQYSGRPWNLNNAQFLKLDRIFALVNSPIRVLLNPKIQKVRHTLSSM
uniref:Cadherin domain-containing protein n=1 Tax=Leptobrachium leishanense TaxID=445787 RepID=A0A8C5MD56_9ANUR